MLPPGKEPVKVVQVFQYQNSTFYLDTVSP